MENFMGQLILENEIDYEAAREYIEEKIREYVSNYAYCCFCKEYRQSDEWRDKNLSEKLAHVLRGNKDIDSFIEYLIGLN